MTDSESNTGLLWEGSNLAASRLHLDFDTGFFSDPVLAQAVGNCYTSPRPKINPVPMHAYTVGSKVGIGDFFGSGLGCWVSSFLLPGPVQGPKKNPSVEV